MSITLLLTSAIEDGAQCQRQVFSLCGVDWRSSPSVGNIL